MDFSLPEELKMIQSLARDFVQGQLKPLEREILGKAADLNDARAYLTPEKEAELVKVVKDLGLWGIGVPEELGGAGLNTLGVCLVEEELAGTIVPFKFGDVTPILFDCNEKQREKYFLPALNYEKHPILALMEGDNGGLAKMHTRAEKVDGHYVINGIKFSFSRVGADYFAVVFALTGSGVSCFLVDKDTPGFTVNADAERSGWLARVKEPLNLVFDNCKVAEENLLGQEGKAFSLGARWLPLRRIVRAARSVGAARRLLEEGGVQAQSATAYGQPAATRTSVRAALADMAAQIHAARLMVYEAASAADNGAGGKDIGRQATMVKLFTSRMLQNVAEMVSHIYNGPTGTAESIKKLCRHAVESHIIELSLKKQRNVIAGDVLKGVSI
jgi:acyl-CoA dehydrogenase